MQRRGHPRLRSVVDGASTQSNNKTKTAGVRAVSTRYETRYVGHAFSAREHSSSEEREGPCQPGGRLKCQGLWEVYGVRRTSSRERRRVVNVRQGCLQVPCYHIEIYGEFTCRHVRLVSPFPSPIAISIFLLPGPAITVRVSKYSQ